MALIDNLVSYYKLDETAGTNALDSHGIYNGTANDVRVFTSEAPGIINTAADFTQGNDYITALTTGTAHNADKSFAVWVKPHATTESVFIAIGKDTGDFQIEIFILSNNTFMFRILTNAVGDVVTVAGGSYVLDEWSFVVGTYEGSTKIMKLYVDGAFIGSAIATSTGTADNNFSLGADYFAGSIGSWTNAIVDEVGVWNKELLSTEVTELWNDGNALAYPFVPVGTNMQVNISDVLKDISEIKINIGGVLKDVTEAKINISDVLKDIF